MFGFKRKTEPEEYDREKLIPAIKASICTGERVAGFKDKRTGKFEDVMLIKNDADIAVFKERYGISDDIAKIY